MLPTGTRLGPYEIVEPLGAGGMGEVYRARDTRLGREVAVKVLPAHLSANPEVRTRFEREAKTVSSLNHPHICTLFDVGREGETDYLVMELVEGETLATHLRRGALPPAELLRLGVQVAEALERAHRAGVIHRDLKPSNIMITRTGANLMDFGLARATGMAGPAGASGATLAALTQSPTVGQALTAEGTLLGTFQYMSPEQLEGREADARSDIWALGCVLFEMATGRRAFEGRSQASLIAAILERQPPPVGESSAGSASGAGASAAGGPPVGLDGLIHDCLAKDPEERVQTVHDVRLRLQRIAQSAGLSISSAALSSTAGGSSGSLPAPVIVRKASPLPWGVAALLLVILVGFLAFAMPRLAAQPPVYRFQPDVSPPGVNASYWPRLSPDGRQLLFQGVDSTNVPRAYVLSLDESRARPVMGTEALQRAYWSPDGREIAFCAGGRLLRERIEGGSPTVVCPAPGGADLSWGDKGVILMDGQLTDSLRQVPAGGGELRPASRIDRKAQEHGSAWPCFLPDGERFLFVGMRDDATYGNIRIGKLGSLESKKIGETSGRVEYAPGGWVVYPKGNALVAQKLDERRMELTGEPITLCEDLSIGSASGHYSVSRAGQLVYMRGTTAGDYELHLADRAGSVLPGTITTGTAANPQISPDGHRVLYERKGPTGSPYGDVYVHDLSRDVDTRLTFTDGYAVGPRWSPDGRRFAVTVVRGKGKVLIGQADGLGATDSIPFTGVTLFLYQWAAAGDRLYAYDNATGIYAADASRPGHTFARVPGLAEMVQGALSPDGRFVAGVIGNSSSFNLFVQSVTAEPGRWQVSSGAMGHTAAWTRGGRELVYETRDGRLMAVDCDATHGFAVGTPKVLFTLPTLSFGEYVASWAPSPDGSRFALVTPSRQHAANRTMEVVTSFDALVHRR